MMTRNLGRWPFVALLLGTGYACSGTPEVTIRPGGTGADAGSSSGATGGKASGGSGGSITGGNAGRIGTTGGAGGKSGNTGGKGGNTGGSGGASSGGTGGGEETGGFGGFPDIDFDYDAGTMGQGGACDRVTDKGTLVKRPMDIIVTIDNSLSMEGEIRAVQDRINDDFAQIIGQSGIDYRVIMVSRYGNVFDENYDGGAASDSAYSVCIDAPLSNLTCPGSQAAATPLVANNPPRFFHHSTDIGSNNLWCRLLDSYDLSDPYPDARSTGDRNGTPWVPVAPNGWGAFLRPEAFKVFIGITDDSPSGSGGGGCPDMRDTTLDGTNNQAGADAFDSVLRTLAPTQFGPVDGERNYRWYSIIGMAGDGTTNPPPLAPDDPTVPTQCCTYNPMNDTAGSQNCIGNTAPPSNGAGNGVGYQYLSILTGGLRYPSCYNDNFDGIFNAIAAGVIEGSRASCEYDVPVPAGGIVDYDQTVVSYLPRGVVADGIELARVADAAACGSAPAYYFNQDFTKIFLCQNTCVTVQADDMAEVSIDFGCLGS